MRRRRLELLLIAVLLGAPAVLAAIRHARQADADAFLRGVATAWNRTSYRGASSWSAGGAPGETHAKGWGAPKCSSHRESERAEGGVFAWRSTASLKIGESPRREADEAKKDGGFPWGAPGSSKHGGFPRGGTGSSQRGGGFSWSGKGPGQRVTVRHDGDTGRTAYWFAGPFHREFVLAEPSHRMPDPAAWCLDVGALLENYRSRELEPREYLGRPVRVLRIAPRHAGRPTVEVWVDSVSHLPLKVSTFRADGSLYRVCKFDRIEYGPEVVEEADLRNAHRYAGTPVSLDNPQAAAEFEPLFPDYLPAGFRLVEARVKRWATPELTLVYSDGVTAFDLRQSPLATPAVLEDFYARGPWGEKWSRIWLSWHMRRARERLVRSDDGAAATVTCEERGYHNSWSLRVEDLRVTLTARGDLGKDEMVKVLRSLQR